MNLEGAAVGGGCDTTENDRWKDVRSNRHGGALPHVAISGWTAYDDYEKKSESAKPEAKEEHWKIKNVPRWMEVTKFVQNAGVRVVTIVRASEQE